MTLIISTVGRCNHRFAQIDRLIVQVPRVVKEPGIFHILEWSLFHAFRFETGHSVNHVYFCLLRDGCICTVYICVYIMWLCRFWKLWYPVEAPLPHFWVSQWVKRWLLRHGFCLTPFPLFLQVIMPRGSLRGREKGTGQLHWVSE